MTGPARLDRLERVTDLVLVLLNTVQPLTLDAIANQVPGYPAEHVARRQAFERDKRLLRDEGIPLVTRSLPDEAQYGYLIDREAFYLPDLELTASEQVALHLAVAGVHLGDPSGRDALLKLGASGVGDVRPIASLVPPEALVELFEAVRTGSEATFGYRGATRRVAPAGLWFRFGHWYLVAWDTQRQDVRTFRVDRVEGAVERAAPGSAALPEGIDVHAALPDDPWVPGAGGDGDRDDLVVTRLLVDPMEGSRVAEEVGPERVEERHDDGSVTLRLEVAGFVPIRAWVLGLGDHAEITEPAAFRSDMRDWLQAIIDEPPAPPHPFEPDAASGWVDGTAGESGPSGRAMPGQEVSRRLARLLAVVGWLAQVGEAPIVQLAGRFGMNEEELVYELELAACCGVPPYTPDTLMEIVVSESTVRAYLPEEFARPRRLTPAEGFAVAASARMILAVSGEDGGDDALRRALDKLDRALGSHAAMGVDVDTPPFLTEVRQASEAARVIRIEYHSASRDESTTRVVEPVQVITVDGHWYLDAYCRQARDMRRFRVDRIRSVQPTRGRRTGAKNLPARDTGGGFVPGPGAVEVHLRLGPGSQWVAESVPSRSLRRDPDGMVTDMILDVAGLAWFERLLLQLGPEASVVRPPELTDLGRRAAQGVLRLYGDEPA